MRQSEFKKNTILKQEDLLDNMYLTVVLLLLEKE